MTIWAARILRRGSYFLSRVWLDPDYSGQPLRCKVTAIRQGTVYYRPHYGWHDDGSEWLGSTARFPLDEADRWVSGPCNPKPR